MLRVRHEKDILRQPARGDAYSTPEIVYGGCQSKIPCELQESPVFRDFPVSWGLARGVRRAEKDPAKESFGHLTARACRDAGVIVVRPAHFVQKLSHLHHGDGLERRCRKTSLPIITWRTAASVFRAIYNSLGTDHYRIWRYSGIKKAFRSWSGKPVKWKKAQFYSSSSASKAESSESKSASRWAVNFFTRWAAGSGASTICMVLPARRGG